MTCEMKFLYPRLLLASLVDAPMPVLLVSSAKWLRRGVPSYLH
jgi:hypothetical protein